MAKRCMKTSFLMGSLVFWFSFSADISPVFFSDLLFAKGSWVVLWLRLLNILVFGFGSAMEFYLFFFLLYVRAFKCSRHSMGL